MKNYIAKRYEDNNIVVVAEDGKDGRKLEHQEKHSPDGFEWGYAGSGPADLARSILWDFLGQAPDDATYQDFKREIIAHQQSDA